MYAFRCKTCGFLHTSDDAAEADHPAACRVCGAGVEFNKFGQKTIKADNWEVLSEVTPKRLKDIGLAPAKVEKHKSWKRGESLENRQPSSVEVSASDSPASDDKS